MPKVCQWWSGCGDDDAVDQYSRDLHFCGTQAAALRDALHLHDHQAIGVVHRGGHGEGLQCQRLALHGDVPSGSAVVPRRNATSSCNDL